MDRVNPEALFGSDAFVSASLVNPKRTASDMAPVLGIKRSWSFSDSASGSTSISGKSGSAAATVSSFSGVPDLNDVVESSEVDEHAFSILIQETASWVSGKRVGDGLVRVLPASEFR